MEQCYSPSFAMDVSIYVVESVSMINTVILLLVIRMTPSLKGFSGVLLLNEQVACLMQEVFAVMFLYARTTAPGSPFHETAQVLRLSAHSVSLCLLFVINFNLYLAVCKGPIYKRLVTWKRVVVIVMATWILCFVWGLVPLFYDFYVLDCTVLHLVPNPTAVTGWWTAGYLLQGGFILIGSIAILLKVRYHRERVHPGYTLRAMSDTQKKMKLMRLAFVAVMFQAIAFTFIELFFYFSNSNSKLAIVFQRFTPIIFALDKMYSCFRLSFYLSLYKPMWETTKSLLPCSRVKVNPRITNVAPTQPTESRQPDNVNPANRDTPINVITSFPYTENTLNSVISFSHPQGTHPGNFRISTHPTEDTINNVISSFPSTGNAYI